MSQQLEQVWRAAAQQGDRLVVAVPAYMSNNNLGLFLGIAAELNIPVVAMVDAAVAATRREYKDAVPVHVDISLHSTVSEPHDPGWSGSVLNAPRSLKSPALLLLFDAWRKVIAEAFVQQSRFDPLHTAETEQVCRTSCRTG